MAANYRTATPLDVQNGDIILTDGYRGVASNVRHYRPEEFGMCPQFEGEMIARYTLNSAPGDGYLGLPLGFGGGCFGGNQRASVAILVKVDILEACERVANEDALAALDAAARVSENPEVRRAYWGEGN